MELGKEADDDEKFVRNLAEAHGLKFEVKRVKLAGLSGRGGARARDSSEFSRNCVLNMVQSGYLPRIPRTTMLKLSYLTLRGAGLAGLSGMKIADGAFLKPLLHTSKAKF